MGTNWMMAIKFIWTLVWILRCRILCWKLFKKKRKFSPLISDKKIFWMWVEVLIPGPHTHKNTISSKLIHKNSTIQLAYGLVKIQAVLRTILSPSRRTLFVSLILVLLLFCNGKYLPNLLELAFMVDWTYYTPLLITIDLQHFSIAPTVSKRFNSGENFSGRCSRKTFFYWDKCRGIPDTDDTMQWRHSSGFRRKIICGSWPRKIGLSSSKYRQHLIM